MAGLTSEERIDRLEKVVNIMAEGHVELEKIVADLAGSTSKAFDLVAKRQDETARQMQETDRRIQNLVSAMGGFLRRQGAAQ